MIRWFPALVTYAALALLQPWAHANETATMGTPWHLQQIDMASHESPTVSRWPAPRVTPDARTFGERAEGRIRYSRRQWCHMQAVAGLDPCED